MAIPQQNSSTVQTGSRFSFGNRNNPATSTSGSFNRRVEPSHEIVGLLKDLRLFNKWGLGKVQDRASGKTISVKGVALADLQIGNHYRFLGKMVDHPTYGPGLDVNQVIPDMDNADALINLVKRNYQNVGDVIAKKMVEHHKNLGTLDKLKNMLVHAPGSVDFSVVTDRQVSLKDESGDNLRRVSDSLSIRFGDLGVARNIIAGMATWLLKEIKKKPSKTETEDKARDMVQLANELFNENPYALLESVAGYGFTTADLMAGKIGISRDDPRRICAIVTHALSNRCADDGHMYLNRVQLCAAIQRIDASIDAAAAITLALDEDQPIVVNRVSRDDIRYYTKALYRAEKTLTNHIASRLSNDAAPLVNLKGKELDDAIERAAKYVGDSNGIEDFRLDDGQMAALRGILTSRRSLHVLTGGPGSGKTAIVEVLMRVLQAEKKLQPIFCAPTGKAAKVLNNRIKDYGVAKTVHSTLGFFGEDGFKRYHGDNLLETNWVVADEQSMMSAELAASFFDAIPSEAHMLLLGDPDQLDPVDAGCPFRSLLTLKSLDHYHLTQTHRNRGALLDLVKSVRDGEWPDGATRQSMVAKGGVQFHGMPEPAPDAFIRLAHEVKDAATRFGGLARVGVLCPKRRGNINTPDWNVTYLNHALRNVLNPDPDGERKVSGTTFRLNDRIIVTKNMMLKSAHQEAGTSNSYKAANEATNYVANGDTGVLKAALHEWGENGKALANLVLHLDDDRQVMFPADTLESLNLSYAITVHAAQGSEYEKVFAFITKGHEHFMHRALVMTQLSRARQSLQVIGDEADVAQIVKRPAPVRNCGLAERVREKLGESHMLSDDAEDEPDVLDTHNTQRMRVAA